MRVAILVPLMLGAACGAPLAPQTASNVGSSATLVEESCPNQVSTLIAGQNIDAGDVSVTNDDTNLYVQISTQDGWLITETHIFAGTGAIPVNRKGIPVPGHFPYANAFSPGVTSYTEVIPLSGLNITCGEELKVAVHAVVNRVVGGVTESQTAWGDGEGFNTPRWAFYSLYATCCAPPPPPPPEECREPVEFWTAADPSSWPTTCEWPVCWSPELGTVWDVDVMAMQGTDLWTVLSQEYIAAKENSVCYPANCVIRAAISRTPYLINDCVIDESEQAEAVGLLALFHAFNTGAYNVTEEEACWH